jgi:surface antigen
MMRGRRGLGLVEVLVGCAIVVTVLYGLAVGIGVADRGSIESRDAVFVDLLGMSLINSLAGLERQELWDMLDGTSVAQGGRTWYGPDPVRHAPWLNSWGSVVAAQAVRFRVELVSTTGVRTFFPGGIRPAVINLDDFTREFFVEIDLDLLGNGVTVTRRYSRFVGAISCEL